MVYDILKVRIFQAMAQTSQDLPGNKRRGTPKSRKENPQYKKRRLDDSKPDDTGDWDDDFDLTQKDLENLDVIASQAIVDEPSTSKQGETGQKHVQGVFQVPMHGAALHLAKQPSTPSSSESSVYPRSSSSLSSIYSRKTLSSDISSAAGSLTSSKSSNGNRSSDEQSFGEVTVQSRAASSMVKIAETSFREELRKKSLEVERARTELYVKDGEVKFLKDSLQRQEQELEKLRAEREQRKDAEDERQKEHAKELKRDIDRLQAQLQFKSQDCAQLQERCHLLESRLMHHQSPSSLGVQASTSAGRVTMSQPQGSPDRSPRVRKVISKESRTPEKGAFPSHHSFMATTDVSPNTAQPAATHSRGTVTAEVSQTTSLLQSERGLKQDQRHLKLDVISPGGKMSGCQLLTQLLQCGSISNMDIEDGGILELLHTLPSRLDLAELQYERDGATSLLSPIQKTRRHSTPGLHLIHQLQITECKPIVEREHFLLAVQGLRNLIEASSLHRQVPAPSEQTQNSAAVLLLPMINDYLNHYIDILSSSAGSTVLSPNLSSSSNKSSSCETGSSLESVTSSQGLLLQQGTEYANSIETLTVCALRVLHTLVCASAQVRCVCLQTRLDTLLQQPVTETSSSTVETDQDNGKASESGMEGDDERSIISSKNSSLTISPAYLLGSPVPRFHSLDILTKLLRLASPSQETSGFKESVVEAALDVLLSLAESLPVADMDRLNSFIARGILSDCLQLEHQPRIVVRALDLFSCLVRSNSCLPSLCSETDTCPLLNVHMVSTRLLSSNQGKQQVQPQMLKIISKVVNSVSSVVSWHRNGVHVLTDNNCKCSGQIIPSLVDAMFFLFRDYQLSHNSDSLCVLRKGIILLRNISLRDSNFQQRRMVVNLRYSILMSGLKPIFKSLDLPTIEVSALEKLWEEEEELVSDSQESDHEDPVNQDEPMATG